MVAIAIDHFLLTTTKKFNRYAISRKEVKTMKTTNTSKADFTQLLRNYENNARNRNNSKEYTDALTSLATSVAYSVLKKCIDVSQNKQLLDVKRSIAKDNAILTALDHASNNAFATVYTQDGDKERKTVDKSLAQAFDKLASQTFGDGLDLVNTAIIAIIEETSKTDLQGNFMETPYNVRRLKKKVWIKSADSVNGWEDVETSPIKEVYKAVRREIENSRAMSTDARNGYTYLEELATDTETDETTAIYKRLPKYADLGGYATDFNGACTLYSANAKTVEDTEILVEKMNLTTKQAKVLQLRMSGYGYKAIATYLGVTQRAVAKTVQAIQTKALAIGLEPK